MNPLPIQIFILDDDAASNLIFGLALQRRFNNPVIRFLHQPAAALETILSAASQKMYVFISVDIKSADIAKILQNLRDAPLYDATVYLVAKDVSESNAQLLEGGIVSGILKKPVNVSSLDDIEPVCNSLLHNPQNPPQCYR